MQGVNPAPAVQADAPGGDAGILSAGRSAHFERQPHIFGAQIVHRLGIEGAGAVI